MKVLNNKTPTFYEDYTVESRRPQLSREGTADKINISSLGCQILLFVFPYHSNFQAENIIKQKLTHTMKIGQKHRVKSCKISEICYFYRGMLRLDLNRYPSRLSGILRFDKFEMKVRNLLFSPLWKN